MKKLLFKVVVLVGILLTVPYYILGGGTMPDFLKNMMGGQAEKPALPGDLSSVTTDKKVTVFKCKDKNGQVQFSDVPCGDGETIHLRPDTNIVKAVKVPEKEEEEEGGSGLISLGGKKDKDGDGSGDGELTNPYSPEGVQKIMKDAQKAAETMNKRNQEAAKVMDRM
ncbi:MAG TPA: DUF4124 domain-containing protein [Gammaproteobacteria bacterium]